MKILHITNNLWSGGVTKLLEDILEELSKEHKVTLLLLGKNDEGYNQEKFKNVKIIFLNQKKLYSLKSIFKIRKYIKENDIIHAHLCPAQFIMNLSGIFLKKYFIITEHNATNNRRKYKILRILEKILYKKYDKIIAVSKDVKKNLVEWLGKWSEEKIEVIYNGIDIEKFKNAKNIRKELWELKDNEKLVFMVARFSKQKDHKTLIKALRILPDEVKCILVGVGETQKEIKEYVKELNLEKRIKFLGFRNDVANVMKSCDLGVLSTNFEGFGIVAAESLAVGTLMIGSKVDGLKEVLKEKELLFKKGNEIELARKINELLYNEKKIKKLKVKMSNEIEKYSIIEMLKNYKKIYI